MIANAWWLAGMLSGSTPSPNPTPGLREGLDESVISPGLAGFLAVFGIALASLVLFYSLTGKLRGVKRRAETLEADDGEVQQGVPDGGTGGGSLPDGSTRPPRRVPGGGSRAPEQPDRP